MAIQRKLPFKASKQNARIVFSKNNKEKKLTGSTGLCSVHRRKYME